MKHWTKKLLSLLLALTILGAMCSTAFAYYTSCPYCGNYLSPTGWTATSNAAYHTQHCLVCRQDVTEPHSYYQGYCIGCRRSATGGTVGGNPGSTAPVYHSNCTLCGTSLPNTNWVYSSQNSGYHYQHCPSCNTNNQRSHTFNNYGTCVYCGMYNSYTGNTGNTSNTLTLTRNTGSYCLTSTDTQNGVSVYDLIRYSIPNYSTANMQDYYVTFTGHSASVATLTGYVNGEICRMTDLSNLYLVIHSGGTWSASYTVSYNGMTQVSSGTVSVVIPAGTGSNLTYTGSRGQTVTLSKTDFQNFWLSSTSNLGTLSYVQITSVTGLSGTLCYNHSTNEGYHSNAIGSYFYVSPVGSQYDLGKLSFVPAMSGTQYPSGSVVISFTAYGTGYNNTLTSASGTATITYSNSSNVRAISYQASGSNVALRSSDFTSVYNEVMGVSISPVFTIQFLDAPIYGKLYYSYSSAITSGIELTQTNIGAYTFSNQASSGNAIDRLTYIPGRYSSQSDTVRYAVYSGATLLYTGTITFNSDTVVISYNSYSNGTYFSAYDFFYKNTALLNTQYVSFGTPSSGALYKNYSAGRGTPVTTADRFTYSTTTTSTGLGAVCFIPAANYTGVVEIPFYATSTSASYVAGTVKIYVVAKPFSDVGNDWSTPYINRLYASGVVGGTSATTFSPKASMKYGEALKMILLAAGYPEQTEVSGANWAYNYLTLAYQKGIVSSMSINLNDAITRDAMAEIAAKALGLSRAASVNVGIVGPTDSTNGYVYALYNAGIVGGDSSSGANRFNGSNKITRAEVAKIICNIMDYKA